MIDNSSTKWKVITNLQNIPYISKFSVQDLARISPYVQEKIYQANEHIVKQDTPADTLYFLVEGAIDVISKSSKKHITSGFIGEESVLQQPNYFYQAKTTKPCKILIFQSKNLNKVLEKYPEVKHDFSISLLRFAIDNREIVDIVPLQKDEFSARNNDNKTLLGWVLAFIIPISLYFLPLIADAQ